MIAFVAGLCASLALTAAAQTAPKISKPCAAARNRVVQQQKAIDDIDRRIERERGARAVCASDKACRRYDGRIESLEKRRAEHTDRMASLAAAEQKTCAAP